MEKDKKYTSAELLAERKWTEFLKSLGLGVNGWRITDYRDFISLRTVASILSNKTERAYSLRQDEQDKTIYNIEVKLKDSEAIYPQ